jgi:hypothetical protein
MVAWHMFTLLPNGTCPSRFVGLLHAAIMSPQIYSLVIRMFKCKVGAFMQHQSSEHNFFCGFAFSLLAVQARELLRCLRKSLLYAISSTFRLAA